MLQKVKKSYKIATTASTALNLHLANRTVDHLFCILRIESCDTSTQISTRAAISTPSAAPPTVSLNQCASASMRHEPMTLQAANAIRNHWSMETVALSLPLSRGNKTIRIKETQKAKRAVWADGYEKSVSIPEGRSLWKYAFNVFCTKRTSWRPPGTVKSSPAPSLKLTRFSKAAIQLRDCIRSSSLFETSLKNKWSLSFVCSSM